MIQFNKSDSFRLIEFDIDIREYSSSLANDQEPRAALYFNRRRRFLVDFDEYSVATPNLGHF